MSVFVTGATGFIGVHLAKKLAGKGYKVHALYRNEKKIVSLTNIPNITLFKGDITNPASIEKAMQGCDEVFHVAAFADVWAKDTDSIYRLNVEATITIFEKALQLNVKRVVFTSTAGIYGPSLEHEVNERTTRALDFFVEYERTKYIAEEKARDYVKKGLDIVIVNPTRVYGPGLLSKSNSVTLMIKKFYEGKWRIIPGNGENVGNYVYIDDVVNGHILAMKKGKTGENYILGGENVSYQDFFLLLRKLTRKKQKLYMLPLWLMLTAAYVMMFVAKLTGQPPLIVPALVRKFNYHWNVSSNKAIRELGYTITSLEKGMQKTIDWIKNAK